MKRGRSMKFDSIVYFIVLLLLLNAPFIFSHGYSHGYKGTADVCVSISDDNQSVNITHILVSYSNYLTPSNKSRMFLMIVSYNNSVVYKTSFNPKYTMIFYDSSSGGNYALIKQNSELFIPFYGASERIDISKDGKIIFSTVLSDYVCNYDGVCENNEDFLTCPSDCPSGYEDGLCDHVIDGRCDPDCLKEYDIDCICGDGECQEMYGEDEITCCQDCGCPNGTVCGGNNSCRPPRTIDEFDNVMDNGYENRSSDEEQMNGYVGEQGNNNDNDNNDVRLLISIIFVLVLVIVVLVFKLNIKKKE